jgi:hypothetical protein
MVSWNAACNLIEFIGVQEARAASIFKVEDGGSTFLRNVGKLLPDYTPLYS